MQTAIVAGGIPAGLMPGAAAEGDAAAIEGVDFAALLMAQIQGQGHAGFALPLAVTEIKEDLLLPTDGVARDTKAEVPQDLFAQLVIDPVPQGAVPVAGFTLPVGNNVARDDGAEAPRKHIAEFVADPVQQGVFSISAFPLSVNDQVPQAIQIEASPEGGGKMADTVQQGGGIVAAIPDAPNVTLIPTLNVVQPESVDTGNGLAVSKPLVAMPTEGKHAVFNGSTNTAGDGRRNVVPSGVAGGRPDQPRYVASPPVQVKAAEFAVDGKSLPSGALPVSSEESVKMLVQDMPKVIAGEASVVIPKPLSADVAHLPEAAPSAVPAMSHTNQTASSTEAKGTPVTSAVQVPVGNAGWDNALGQKVVWMAGQQQQVAELHLNPPHLGPMEVRLSISNDQVSALFVSHQPAVREAIEAAMPRLREILADNGMILGNATVSSDSLPRQQQHSGGEGQSGMTSRPDSTFLENSPAPLARGILSLRNDGRGMVDLFA